MTTHKANHEFRTKSRRLPCWDYSGIGYYFITLVTQNRECNLGKIVSHSSGDPTHGRAPLRDEIFVKLSGFGKIVEAEWNHSFKIRKELCLDIYCIMPNHLHAIIKLSKPINKEYFNLQNSRSKANVNSINKEDFGSNNSHPKANVNPINKEYFDLQNSRSKANVNPINKEDFGSNNSHSKANVGAHGRASGNNRTPSQPIQTDFI